MDATAKAETTVAQGGRAGHTARGTAQRAALVQAAFDLIAERGFEGLRTRDIAARARVNIATLHYYFATKEDLIRAVVDALVERFRVQGEISMVAQPKNPLNELRQELRDAEYQVRETPELFAVLFELFNRSLRDPAIKAILRDADAHFHQRVTSYLGVGVEQGIFRTDLDIPAAASALIVLIKGLAIQMMTDLDGFPAERVNTEIERWLTGQMGGKSA
jgi:AcrR family transcriptional regulator